MTLYAIDTYADRTKAGFSLYLVRSDSEDTAKASVNSFVRDIDQMEAIEVRDQTIMKDLPKDAPHFIGYFEAEFIRSV